MSYKRLVTSLASVAGILMLSSVLVFGQQAGSTVPSQRMGPGMMNQGMMSGYGMMAGTGGMGPGMMGGSGMMGPGMMGGGPGGMMDGPMMQMMMSDSKTRGQMLEIHGRMMKEMGELMMKRGQELEQAK